MTYIVTITKKLEDFWGFDELHADSTNFDEFREAAIRLLYEDISAVLEGAHWEIVVSDDEDDAS